MIIKVRHFNWAKTIVERKHRDLDSESHALLDWMLRVLSLELADRATSNVEFMISYKPFYGKLVICAESTNNYVHEFQTPFCSESQLTQLLEEAENGLSKLPGFTCRRLCPWGTHVEILEVYVER